MSFLMVENQEKKKIGKGGWIFIGIFALIVLWIAIDSGKNATVQQNQTTSVQVDPLQERIERINEVFSEDQNFEKVEKIDESTIGIYFSSDPVEDIETITRGQSMNLSNETNNVASVKTFVGGNAKMFCTATKGQVNDCIDYR